MLGKYEGVALTPVLRWVFEDRAVLDSSSSLEWLEANSNERPSVSEPESESFRCLRCCFSSLRRRSVVDESKPLKKLGPSLAEL